MKKLLLIIGLVMVIFVGSAYADALETSMVWDDFSESRFRNSTTYDGYEVKLRHKITIPEKALVNEIYRIEVRAEVECDIKASTHGGYEKYTDTEKIKKDLWVNVSEDGKGTGSHTIYLPFERESKFQIYDVSCGYSSYVITAYDKKGRHEFNR